MSIERSQYHETKYFSQNSPGRHVKGSAVDLTQFDNKLDVLLDDLQSSVGNEPCRRWQSSNIIDKSTGNSVNKLLINTPKSASDIRSEEVYSYKGPIHGNGLNGYEEKEESYVREAGSGREYTESKKSYVQKSTTSSKLDPLLNNLKQINGTSNKDYHYGSASDYSSKMNWSEKTTTQHDKIKSGNIPSSYESDILEKVENEILPQSIDYVTNTGTYTSSNKISQSPSTTSKKLVHIKNVQTQPIEVMEATVPDIDPEVLENLDPNLIPTGNTKVTTTIKTYTYEIPANRTLGRDGSLKKNIESGISSQKYSYSPNVSITTPSKSFVYEKNEENLLRQQREVDYTKRSRSLERHKPNNWKQDIYRSHSPGSQKETYVYKESIKDRSYYPGSETHIKEIFDERYTDSYNRDIHDTNVFREPEREPLLTPSRGSISPKPTRILNYEYQKTTTDDRTKSPIIDRTNEPINIKYRYSSKHSATNNYTGSGYEDKENVPIRPFPLEDNVDGPPKRLDDLMANIGKEPKTNSLNVGFLQHEQDLINKKKGDALKKQAEEVEDLQRKKDLSPTKNVTGSPVYYPPGHELFQKKEEAGAGWRAEGAYAREGGKYKYEAESGGKSKSKSGAAVVPVCLPCCCGLPCTIL